MKNFQSMNFFQTKQNLRVKHMWRKRGIENHLEYLQVPAILQPLLAKDTQTAELGAASTEIEISVSVIFPTRPSFFWLTLHLWTGQKKNTVKRKKKVQLSRISLERALIGFHVTMFTFCLFTKQSFWNLFTCVIIRQLLYASFWRYIHKILTFF